MILRADSLGLSLPRGSGNLLINGISLELRNPELAVLAGPNGSGKSLLLELLCGIRKPDTGKVTIDGASFPKAGQLLGRSVGLVFQNPEHQMIGQTVEEEIRFGLDIARDLKADSAKITHTMLEWAGLSDKARQSPDTLSGGEQRRLALASVLALQPEIVLMDEPFNGLDYEGVKLLLARLLDLRERGIGILVVTHHLEMLLAHADRLIIMKGGRVIGDGVPERILPYAEDHGVRRPPGRIQEMSWLG